MKPKKISGSQYTYIREERALRKMPKTNGVAACSGDTRFDIFGEVQQVAKEVRKELAKVCAKCPMVCGFRVDRPE